MTGNDIELIPTVALINELMRRHEHSIFAGVQTNVGGQNNRLTARHYSGDWAYCSGLCNEIINVINNDRTEGEVDDNEQET